MNLRRVLVLIAATLLIACASGPPPEELELAEGKLEGPHVGELEYDFPRLVAESRSYATRARRAWSQGDEEDARVLALLAYQHITIAEHLEAERSAERLRAVMEGNVERLDQSEAQAQRMRDAIRVFDQRRQRARNITFDAATPSMRADLEAARRELLAATNRQLEALELGAPVAAPEPYALGEERAEESTRALQELRSQVALRAALDAHQHFRHAIDASRDSDLALRRELLAQQGSARSPEALAAQSQRLITEAEAARERATTDGLPVRDPEAFEDALLQLESARRYAEEGDDTLAIRRARGAIERFSGRPVQRDEVPPTIADADAGAQPSDEGPASEGDTAEVKDTAEASDAEDTEGEEGVPEAVNANADAARARIREAEDRRFEIIGLGLEGAPRVAQADYALELARSALAAGDPDAALSRADDARSLFEAVITQRREEDADKAAAASAPSSDANPPTAAASETETPPTRAEITSATPRDAARAPAASSGELDALARRMILELQLARAEALGEGTDALCPNVFREFEALLQLAQSQLDIGQTPTAFELAIRAEERFKKCGSPAAAPRTSPTSQEESSETRRARERSAARLATAQEARAALTGTASGRADFDQLTTLVQTAERWHQQGDYEQSVGFSERAVDVASRVEAQLDEEARAAQAEVSARQEASKALSGAQDALAEATRLTRPDDARLREARTILDAAATWFGNGDWGEALTQSRAARSRLDAIIAKPLEEEAAPKDTAAKTTPPEKDPRANAAQTTAQAQTPDTSPMREAPQTRPCGEVGPILEKAAVAESQIDPKRLDGIGSQRLQRALIHLEQARERARDDCEVAVLLASDARASLTELATEQQRPTAPTETTARTAPDDEPATSPEERAELKARAEAMIARAEVLRTQVEFRSETKLFSTGTDLLERARKRLMVKQLRDAQRLAEQAAFAFESLQDEGGEVWREPYNRIIDALILRDQSIELLGERVASDTRHATGLEMLERANRAWEREDFIGAGRFGEEAARNFQRVLDDIALQESAERKRELARREAEAEARREAEALERREDEARRSREAAERAEQDAAEEAEREAAERARAERAEQDAAIRAAAREKEQLQAETELREADILAALCVERDCASRDLEAHTRATRELEDARRYLEAGEFEQARRLATSAAGEMQRVLDARPTFTIPADVSRVRLRDDRLVLTPRITFLKSKDTLTDDAQGSVEELARSLLFNDDVDYQLRVVGYTDSSGSDRQNTRLSQRRADAVREALLALGVPGTLVAAEGRGEANPIADNDTAEGREANRRVEFELTVREREE